MLAIYQHRDTWLHRRSAGHKLGFVALAGTVLFFVQNNTMLIVLLLLVGLMFLWARIGINSALTQLKPVSWFLLLVFLAHYWFAGLGDAVTVTLRLLTLLLLALLFTFTTRSSDITDSIIVMLNPLGRWGFPVEQVGLMLSLTLRYIPLLHSQFVELREAQEARCCRPTTVSLILPLLVKSLKLADQFSEALDARGFDSSARTDLMPHRGRTRGADR